MSRNIFIDFCFVNIGWFQPFDLALVGTAMVRKHVFFFLTPPLRVHNSVNRVRTFTFILLLRCLMRIFDLVTMVFTWLPITRPINSAMHKRLTRIPSSPLRWRLRINFLIPGRGVLHPRWTRRIRRLLLSLSINRFSLAPITTLSFGMSLHPVVTMALFSIAFFSLAASLSSLRFLVRGDYEFIDCFSWESCQTRVACSFH